MAAGDESLSCPYCRTALLVAEATTCPACRGGLFDAAGGRLTQERAALLFATAAVEEARNRLVEDGLRWAVGVGAVVTLAPWLTPLALPIATVAQAVSIRWWMVAPARRVFQPTRRMLARWTLRVGYVLGLSFAGPWMAAPFLSLVATPAWHVALVTAEASYLRWQLDRESSGTGLHDAERVGLGCMVALLVGVLVLLMMAAGVMGWLAQKA